MLFLSEAPAARIVAAVGKRGRSRPDSKSGRMSSDVPLVAVVEAAVAS
jgi:hypothetical protein